MLYVREKVEREAGMPDMLILNIGTIIHKLTLNWSPITFSTYNILLVAFDTSDQGKEEALQPITAKDKEQSTDRGNLLYSLDNIKKTEGCGSTDSRGWNPTTLVCILWPTF